MGWLTGYGYRQEIEVANPAATGDRLLSGVPFLAAFLYTVEGKITSATYNDVHVTKSDGTTELPVTVAATSLTIDYAAMPQGRTKLYVYYGNSGASAPTASSFPSSSSAESGGTLVDSGFNSGSNGATLGSPWTLTAGGGTGTYDNSHPGYKPAGGLSTMGGKLASAAAASTILAESASSGMSSNTSEMRFWVYHADTTHTRTFLDAGGTPTLYWDWHTDGTIRVYLNASEAAPYNASGYHTIAPNGSGSYATGLTQYKVVWNFTTHTFTLATRTALGADWTYWKKSGASDNNIPFRAAAASSWGGAKFIAYDTGSTLWVDEVQYASGGITDIPGTTTVQWVTPREEYTSEGDTAPDVYVTFDDVEATQISSDATGTYYGGASSHKVGVTTGGAKHHYLLKALEHALLLGTVSAATLYVNASAVAAGNIDVRVHRFKSNGAESTDGRTRQDQWNHNGVTCNDADGYPTWTNRYYNQAYAGATAWRTAGATDSGEIDPAEYVTLSVTGGSTGWKSVALTAAWVEAWQGDYYNNGLLLKDSTDSAGASDRQLTITAPSQANAPVLKISYSALASDQLAKRKITADTYHASTFAVQNRYALTPSENSLGVMCNVNAEMGLDFFYISATGRIRKVLKNQRVSGNKFSASSPCWGLHYDEIEGRFWVAGTHSGTQTLLVGYTSPYVLDTPTWSLPGTTAVYKGTFFVSNGNLRMLYPTYANGSSPAKYDALSDRSFTRATGTWGSAVEIYNTAISGTIRTLGTAIGSSDVMTGAGTITLSGSAASYPSFGMVLIGSEAFWYTGKSGSDLTGVSRAMFNTTAAAHSTGVTVHMDQREPTYIAMSYDATNSRLHAFFQIVSYLGDTAVGYPPNTDFSGVGAYGYHYTVALSYNYLAGVWEKADGTDLTLPLTNTNLSDVITRNSSPAYSMNLCALANGVTLATFGEFSGNIYDYPSDSATAGAYWQNTRVARLVSGAWSSVDATPDGFEASIADLGSGHVSLTSLSGTTTPTVSKSASGDSGATWGGTLTVATHSFDTPNTLGSKNTLWCSNGTERGYLGGKGIVYWQHFCPHGAIYLNALDYPTYETPSRGDATADGRAPTDVYADTASRGEAIADGRAPTENFTEGVTRGEAIADAYVPTETVTTTETPSRGAATADARAPADVTADVVTRGEAVADARAPVDDETGGILVHPQLPAGTVVGAYRRWEWKGSETARLGAGPGAAVTTAEVDSDLAVTFYGLDAGEWVAYSPLYPNRRLFFLIA